VYMKIDVKKDTQIGIHTINKNKYRPRDVIYRFIYIKNRYRQQK